MEKIFTLSIVYQLLYNLNVILDKGLQMFLFYTLTINNEPSSGPLDQIILKKMIRQNSGVFWFLFLLILKGQVLHEMPTVLIMRGGLSFI